MTNSGKTYTMVGNDNQLDGLVPQTMDFLMNLKRKLREEVYTTH